LWLRVPGVEEDELEVETGAEHEHVAVKLDLGDGAAGQRVPDGDQPGRVLLVAGFERRCRGSVERRLTHLQVPTAVNHLKVKKGSPYSTAERRVPELIPVLGSRPAGDVSHKPGGRLPLHSARPAVTPATLKKVATNFAAW